MKREILDHLNDPKQLEKLYGSNRTLFKREFNALYPEIKDNILTSFWHERLNYQNNEINWGSRKELLAVLIASLLAGLIAKLPQLLSIDEDFFYPRNLGFIIFPILTIYFAWKNKISIQKIISIICATIGSLILINLLPNNEKSDTLILSCIHLILFLWSLLGFAFISEKANNEISRLNFLKYNGDLIVMTTLILIAGAIMSAATVGLFSLIGFNIEEFYFENIAIIGLASAPIVGTYLTETNPQLVGKVSPVIAKLFSPLVLIMLAIYLIAIVYSGKDPYNDRESLIIFNALLIGVMAIIFFSISESPRETKSNTETFVLLALCIITIIINGIALSAILFRISEWGFTPNRTAVLGGNILILIHLLLVTTQFFKVLSKRAEAVEIGKTIASYLPIYFIWTFIVTFLFPSIFGFK